MKHLPATLTLMATLWPLLLAAGWWDRTGQAPGLYGAVTYFVASHICHQRPERSFTTRGHQWPVCGRCAGLYLAAPLGAWYALVSRRRSLRNPVLMLAAASLPTVATVALELADASAVTSLMRAVAALPLGACLAFLVVGASRSPESIG